MIEAILQKAANAIYENVAPVSKSGGAVQLVSLRDGKRVYNVPAVPASADGSNQGNDYIAMIPADTESAVAFWQVLSTQIDSRQRVTAQQIPMLARARLVVWANKKRLSPPDVQAVLVECIRQVQTADLSEDWIQGINKTVVNIEQRDKGIFSDYGFDEVENQYLTEPYDFASALFDMQYTIMLTCLPEVSAVETAC